MADGTHNDASQRPANPANGANPANPAVATGSSHDFAWPPRIAGHEVMDRLGDGGCATVWKCREHGSGRIVAVKVPRPELATADFIERFEDECQLLLRLRTHPNVVGVIGREVATLADGRRVPALVMEYIANGRALLDHADAAGLSLHERLALFRAVCAGVAHLHKAGIVHLDLKPKNILVDDTGTPRVMDLGAAKVLLANDVRSAFFTPQYASPEQLRGAPEALEQTSDVYSLGKILAALVAGPSAIALGGAPGGTLGAPGAPEASAAASTSALAWRPARFAAALPRPLPSIERIVERATAPIPGQRFADATALALAMDDAMTPWTTHAFAIIRRAGESTPPWLKDVAIVATLGLIAALVAIPLTVAGMLYGTRHVLSLWWPTPEHYPDVRLVVLPAEPDFAALSAASGAVDLGTNPGQLRAMWAAAIDRLAAAGAAVVVCDIAFPQNDRYVDRTAALAGAIQRARAEHGCPVVVGIDGAVVASPRPDQLAPALRAAGVTFGGALVQPLENGAFAVAVAVHPPMRRAMPALSTAAAAAFVGRTGDCDVFVDEREDDLLLIPDIIDGRRVPLWRTGRHPLHDHRGGPLVVDGLNEGDVIGLLAMGSPDGDLLREITITPAALFAMSSAEVAEFARGRVVLLANNWMGAEEHTTADGRQILKPWLHVAAIQLMLQPPGEPVGTGILFLWMLLAGAVGAALAVSGDAASRTSTLGVAQVGATPPSAGRLARRAVVLPLIAAAILAATWLAMGTAGVQVSLRPAAAAIALCVGVVLGVEYRLLRRAWMARRA